MMKVDLDNFFNPISSIEYKNRGGCLFFCYCFWLWLKKNGYDTSSFQIKQYCYDGANIEHNLDWLEGDIDGAQSSSHFTFIYKGIEYDGDGEACIEPYSDYPQKILDGLNANVCCLVEDFCVSALNDAPWNDTFDRESAIERVESVLDIDLSNVNPVALEC